MRMLHHRPMLTGSIRAPVFHPTIFLRCLRTCSCVAISILASLIFGAGASVTVFSQDLSKASLPYLHQVWTTEQGLPQNSVTSIIRTRDGYLWIGTFGGLAR